MRPKDPDPDNDLSPPSLYDDDADADDLWFVPPDPELDPAMPPGPAAPREPLSEPTEWLRAEARLGRELALAAGATARLDERLRLGGVGVVRRIALSEAAALSWQAGDRVAVERLALHDLDRADMLGDDASAVGAAHWAFRRLSGGPPPEDDIHAFLAREGIEDDPAIGKWRDDLAQLDGALPIVRAAWAFFAWRAAGLSAGLLEPAVIAGRLGGADLRTLPFLPLGQAHAPFNASGEVQDRLDVWARAATTGTMRALMTLDALADWEVRARTGVTDLSGRTPGLLIDTFRANPILSATMAARATGASVAAVRRNLELFSRRGFVRELTGQGRFRFWQAAI